MNSNNNFEFIILVYLNNNFPWALFDQNMKQKLAIVPKQKSNSI